MDKLDTLETECTAAVTMDTAPAKKPKKKKRTEADLLNGMDMGPAAGGMAGDMVAVVSKQTRKRSQVTSLFSEMFADRQVVEVKKQMKKQQQAQPVIVKKTKTCFDFVNTKHSVPKEALGAGYAVGNEESKDITNQKNQSAIWSCQDKVLPLDTEKESQKSQETDGSSLGKLPVLKGQDVIQGLLDTRQEEKKAENSNDQQKQETLGSSTVIVKTVQNSEDVLSSKEQDLIKDLILDKNKLDDMLSMKVCVNLQSLQKPETDSSTVSLKMAQDTGAEEKTTEKRSVIVHTSTPQPVVPEPARKSPVVITIEDSDDEEDPPQLLQLNIPSVEPSYVSLNSPYDQLGASTSTSASTSTLPSPYGLSQGLNRYVQPFNPNLMQGLMNGFPMLPPTMHQPFQFYNVYPSYFLNPQSVPNLNFPRPSGN